MGETAPDERRAGCPRRSAGQPARRQRRFRSARRAGRASVPQPVSRCNRRLFCWSSPGREHRNVRPGSADGRPGRVSGLVSVATRVPSGTVAVKWRFHHEDSTGRAAGRSLERRDANATSGRRQTLLRIGKPGRRSAASQTLGAPLFGYSGRHQMQFRCLLVLGLCASLRHERVGYRRRATCTRIARAGCNGRRPRLPRRRNSSFSEEEGRRCRQDQVEDRRQGNGRHGQEGRRRQGQG